MKNVLKLTRTEKQVVLWSAVLAFGFTLTTPANAMHIMEGYLPPLHSLLWGAVAIPFVVAGLLKIKKITQQQPKSLLILAMAGAYTFVLSALKIPSVTGSSSHPTGTGLGAILFGPAPMAVLGLIVLVFQALLLAHGGLTTLGANTFSMAVAGPIVSFGVYKLAQKTKLPPSVGIFLAASLGNLFTYLVTSFQLALAHPSATGGITASLGKFMGVFALTQLPIAVIEGLLTVIIVLGLETWAEPELKAIGFEKEVAS